MQKSLETRKELLIIELYKTGCLNGLYFGTARQGNPIRGYIKSCMYKQRLSNSHELIDDCYHECFMHLQAMSPEKICGLYDEAPAKLIATALRIISLKCFAIDPRYGNPKHSLMQSILFASVKTDYIDPCDVQVDEETDDFTLQYGATIEQLIQRLTDDEQVTFYGMIQSKKRGKVSNALKTKRNDLISKIQSFKQPVQYETIN